MPPLIRQDRVGDSASIWERSLNEFSDIECPYLKVLHDTLENCKNFCLEEQSCTAFNYERTTGDSNNACILRHCNTPVVPPAQNKRQWYDGYWLGKAGREDASGIQGAWESSKNDFYFECKWLWRGNKGSLENCKTFCLEVEGCTAFNYHSGSTNCELLGCDTPVVPPASDNFNGYDGYWLRGS